MLHKSCKKKKFERQRKLRNRVKADQINMLIAAGLFVWACYSNSIFHLNLKHPYACICIFSLKQQRGLIEKGL